MNLVERAADRNLEVASRVDAIRRLSEHASYSSFANLWPLATSPDEDPDVAEAAGRALASILNAGPAWDQGEMAYFSALGTHGFLAAYEGSW